MLFELTHRRYDHGRGVGAGGATRNSFRYRADAVVCDGDEHDTGWPWEKTVSGATDRHNARRCCRLPAEVTYGCGIMAWRGCDFGVATGDVVCKYS